jgi:hypothetical protein
MLLQREVVHFDCGVVDDLPAAESLTVCDDTLFALNTARPIYYGHPRSLVLTH